MGSSFLLAPVAEDIRHTSKTKMIPTLIYLFCLLPMGLCFPTPTENYTDTEILVGDKYRMLWRADTINVTIEIQVATQGWCGFGLSSNGQMRGSDIVIGWVKDGEVFFHDRYATAEAEPSIDELQDWTLLHGVEEDGFTVLKFTRTITTCDEHDRDITFEPTNVLYAWNEVDPDDITGLRYHDERGTKVINLLYNPVDPPLPENVTVVTLSMNNYTVPDADTTYYCKTFKVNLTDPHHVVKFDTHVQEGNEKLVHHLVMYACPSYTLEHSLEADCTSRPGVDMSQNEQFMRYHCSKWMYGWAVGSLPFSFQEDIGFPIGGPGAATWYLIEMHYDNPGQVAGFTDSSTLNMYVTPDLRENEASLIPVGTASSTLIIPPEEKEFRSVLKCSSGCINKALSENNLDSVKVFAVGQHGHIAARGVITRHFRDGKELEPIMDEEHYDFNAQIARYPPEGTEIRPGDEIVVECRYDTTNRTKATFGGQPTHFEMCISFLYVTPALPLQCWLWYDETEMYDLIGIQNVNDAGYVTSPTDQAGKHWSTVVNELEWTEGIASGFQSLQRNGKQIEGCSTGHSYETMQDVKQVTPYLPPTSSCAVKDQDKKKDKDDDPPPSSTWRLTADVALLHIILCFGTLVHLM